MCQLVVILYYYFNNDDMVTIKLTKLVNNEALYYFIIVICAILSIFNLYFLSTKDTVSVLGANTSASEDVNSILFWEEYLKENPNYFPALAELAKLQLESGNLPGYEETVEKIQRLNPNSRFVKYLKGEY